MLKADLRKKYKALRKGLSEEDRIARSQAICAHLLKLFSNKELVHIYLPIKRLYEVDTHYFLENYPAKQLVVSKSNFHNFSMKHYRYSSVSQWEENSYNIMEPVDGEIISANKLNVVLTPLLCCDKEGNRVGYGAGFYDRFFNQCKADCLKVGLSYFSALEEVDDLHPEDIPLDYLVHPDGVIKF
jgi:5-formyltetrahydrofolate cyclo-ligase